MDSDKRSYEAPTTIAFSIRLESSVMSVPGGGSEGYQEGEI